MKGQACESRQGRFHDLGGYLGCAGALFRFAVANRLLSADPSQGVKVSRKQKPGTKMLGYTDEEVAHLLELASAAHEPWKKWLPWLAAATGSRIGEVAHLHGSHIFQDGDIFVVKIKPAPDAGSIKNPESEREVPLHSALIKAGFLEFAKERGQGPLFCKRRLRGTFRPIARAAMFGAVGSSDTC